MTKYMFVYHAPTQPADAQPADPAEMEAVMGQWMSWAGPSARGWSTSARPWLGA